MKKELFLKLENHETIKIYQGHKQKFKIKETMKAIKTLNTIALCIPIFISLFAIFERGLLALALFSTMVTGSIQIILAFKYWQKNPKNIFIKIYFFIVAVFFFFLCYSDGSWIWYLPPVLCLYLSLLIYTHEIK